MKIEIAAKHHIKYCNEISETIKSSAEVRGTGIALRTPEYIQTKIENNNAVIATVNEKFAGFCYIEIWGHGKYVAHSGLIVHPDFRGMGLAKKIKKLTFEHSLSKYPKAQLEDMCDKKEKISANCQFCGRKFQFSLKQISDYYEG